MRITLHNSVVHNTAQNSSDNHTFHPRDFHHCSDVVYWKGGEEHRLVVDRQTSGHQHIPRSAYGLHMHRAVKI